MNEDRFLEVAKQAALEAGKIIQKYSSQFGEKIIKNQDNSNFVTKADLESEKKIVKILRSYFPDHKVIAEEGGGVDKDSEYVWMVDPLDGTITFTQNIPYYTVSIGLLKNGKPILGVINHISFKNLYWAQSGKGAYLNGKKIQVSKKLNLETAVCVLGVGHRQKRQQKLDLYINKLITKVGFPYEFGSAAVTAALVAGGVLDLYVAGAYPWDFAAGTVIVSEACGRVTDLEGKEPDWVRKRMDLVFSNGLLHDEILEALKA